MFLQVSFNCEMKVEANRLKNVPRTTVVALGIGNTVTAAGLNNIASAPSTRNVIRVRNFASLSAVEDRLTDVCCTGL